MDKLLDTLTQYLQAAQHVVAQYAPSVWSATLQLIRAHAIFDLAMGFVLLGGTAALVWFVWIPFCKKHQDLTDGAVWMTGLLFIGPIIFGCLSLFDFDNWLGLFAPQLEILAKVAAKAGLL